ncbi:protein FD-like isoform X2 [Mercurialis annua]|uniref:protein FD-like isoform X2 n=1 Tax=Mercurialis annua TaxID=3986 RepID=UPI00215F7A7A|nr:protein FD-like isoform X2 [Mercurialis annua]
MEDVWKDINLSCLQDRRRSAAVPNASNHHAFPGMIIQDFLARPFGKDPAPPSSSGPINHTLSSSVEDQDLLNRVGSRNTAATILSLNCASNVGLQNHLTRCLGSANGGTNGEENLENCKERRHKRQIKNREAAARSRARKQAYTQELEVEVANLLEENGRLKRQQEKLKAAPAQLPKKKYLYRTSSAPI